jgi:hypothetical protein
LFSLIVAAQGRLNLNNNAFIRINGGSLSTTAYLVIDNNASNAISTLGTGGNIVSEGEYNKVKWRIGTSTNSYTVPLTDASANKIPLAVSVTDAGVGTNGNILFSTIPGANFDNSTYLPSDVTDVNRLGSNNSSKVVDRFWIIDPQNFTSKPDVTLSFTYVDAEVTQIGNNITPANLQAQRFSSSDGWNDFSPSGTVNTTTKIVSNIVVSKAQFSRSWTLVDNSSPLPVHLLYFKTKCFEDKIQFLWTTTDEFDNDYFVLEKSKNNIQFEKLDSVNAIENSKNLNFYEFNVNKYIVNQYHYFRLTQFDLNKKMTVYNSIFCNCSNENQQVYFRISNLNNNQLLVNSFVEVIDNYEISIFNATGLLLYQTEKSLTIGSNIFELPKIMNIPGIYFISFSGGNQKITQKIIIE